MEDSASRSVVAGHRSRRASSSVGSSLFGCCSSETDPPCVGCFITLAMDKGDMIDAGICFAKGKMSIRINREGC